jgi:tetratricopeptide (TPR) repeat protein
VNPDELADLEEQRSFLARSLDDLDRELAAGDIDELDALTLRNDYSRRLAEVQHAIETGETERDEAVRVRPLWQKVTAVAIVGVLAVSAGLTVAAMAGERGSGDTATGNLSDRNFEGLLAEAASKARTDPLAALRDYDVVLDQDPDNLEAMAEKGFLLASLSEAVDSERFLTEGEALLRDAIERYPDEPRPHFYLGLVLFRLKGDNAGALREYDAALALDPPDVLKTQIEQQRAEAADPE